MTQRYIGKIDIYKRGATMKKVGIHVLDYNGKIIDFISQDDGAILAAEMNVNEDDKTNTFDFTVKNERSENLRKRNKIIVQDQNGVFHEYVIVIVDDTFEKETTIKCNASYLEDLKTAKPIPPGKLEANTTTQALLTTLADTGWEVSDETEYGGNRSTSWTAYTTPYDLINMLCTTYDMVADFYIELGSHEVEHRYVKLSKPNNAFKGKEIEKGVDLMNMTRTIDMSEVVTALIALSPEAEDGSRTTTVIKDDDAQAQFGLPGRYIWDVYEPESNDESMTLKRLTTLAKTEMNKRNKASVSYEVSSVDISKFYNDVVINIRDIVRVKDRDFNPPLYIETEVVGVVYDWLDDVSDYKFGTVKEYKEYELREFFYKKLDEITKKVNDKNSNVDTIVTDMLNSTLEYYERKIFKGDEPPSNPKDDTLWYDTTNPNVAVLRRYHNGEWINETVSNVKQIGGVTREQALYSELKNSFINLGIQHSKLDNEVSTLLSSEYLVDETIKNDLTQSLYELSNTYSSINSNLNSINEETATIGFLIDTQQLFMTYRQQLHELNRAIKTAQYAIDQRLKLLQSQYTDEKFNEAMTNIANTLPNGQWDANKQVLLADIPNKDDVENLKNTLQNYTDGQINNLSSVLGKEIDSKINTTKSEISAKISSVERKIDGIEVGGRNLLLGTLNYDYGFENDLSSRFYDENNKRWLRAFYSFAIRQTVAVEKGKEYTISFTVKPVEEGTTSTAYTPVRDEFTDKPSEWITYKTFTNINKEQRLSFTITPNSDKITLFFLTVSKEVPDIYFTDIKLEKGNVATDWTPAPEDVQNEIVVKSQEISKAQSDAAETRSQAYADSKITEEEQARIRQADANVELLQQQQQSLKNEMAAYADNLVNEEERARIEADTAKEEALKAEINLAETQANAYADNKITAEEERAIKDAENKLSEAKKHAEEKAEHAQSLANEYAKAAQEKAQAYADDKVNNLSVGGRNLVKNSEKITDYIILSNIEKAGTYSLGFEPHFTENIPSEFGVYYGGDIDVLANDKPRITHTFEVSEDRIGKDIRLFFGGTYMTHKDFVNNGYVGKVKLEYGNFATDYTLAPEDIEDEILNSTKEAEEAAKAYAKAQDELKQTEIQAYADGIVSDEEKRAIADAIAKRDEAKEYADQKAQEAQEAANKNTINQLKPITTRVTTNEANITELDKQISLMAKSDDVAQKLRNVDGRLTPLETTVKSNKATLDILPTQIESKVSKQDYTTDKNNIVQRLDNADSERKQLSNEITDKVTITKFESGITEAKSYTDNAKEEVTTYTDNKFNNLNVGGRNLFQSHSYNLNGYVHPYVTNTKAFTSDRLWATSLYSPDYFRKFITPNETYTIHYEITVKSYNGLKELKGRTLGLLLYDYTDRTTLESFTVSAYNSGIDNSLIGKKQSMTKTFKMPETFDNKINILSYAGYGNNEKGERVYPTVEITNLKLEKGTIATDWTPAPEDIESAISNSNEEAQKAAQAYSDAQDNLQLINAKAYADGIVNAEEQRAIQDAENKLETAKQDAQNKASAAQTAAQNYAVIKANNAETNAKNDATTKANKAEANAKAYTDAYKQNNDVAMTKLETSVSQLDGKVSIKVDEQKFNASQKTLSKVLTEIAATTSGINLSYDNNGTIQGVTVDNGGVKLRGDKVDITVNDAFRVMANRVSNVQNDVSNKVNKDDIINRLNLSPEGLDINVNNIGIRGGDSVNYLDIRNNSILSYGVFTRTWANETDTANLRLGIQGGTVKIQNRTTGYNLYLTEKGLSTMLAGAGDETAGTLEFHSTKYNDTSRGVRLHSTYGAVALESDYSRIILNANLTVNIESNYGIYFRPFRDNRTGNNEFAMYVKQNDSGALTDGVIKYGNVSSKTSEYGSGLRFSKSSVKSTIYATNKDGDIGTGDFYGDKIFGDLTAKGTNVYVLVDNELRITDKKGYNNGNVNYKDLRANSINTTHSYAFANHSGSDVYFGVGYHELRITANNFWNGGNPAYQNIRFGKWYAMSSEKFKYDIKEWDYSVLDAYRNDLKLYSYKYKSEKDSEYIRNHHGVIIERELPIEWRHGDGFDGNEVMFWNAKAIQEIISEQDKLKKENEDIKNKYKNLEKEVEELKSLIKKDKK